MFFNSMLETLLFDTKAAGITEAFLWMTALGFIIAVLLAILDKGQRFIREAPTLLTSLGILGTFVGIVVGLMHFDPQNIDGSISTLLEGLKTAFITSLAGMSAAIALKILTTMPMMVPRRGQIDTTNAGPEDILKALLDQSIILDQLRLAISGTEETSLAGQFKLLRSDQIDHHKETLRTLTDVRIAVAGAEETSLVGQLKLLRSDEHDRHRETMRIIGEDRGRHDSFAEKLWKELDAVGEMLSKSATEQMMAALKEVIADFNNNLTEQFGDNFKALDASVQKLVQWQENYRLQLEQMSSQYAQGVAAITQTEASIAHISVESQQIPAAMEKLKAVILVNQHQLSELSRYLEAFRDIRDKAVEAVPQIREQIEQTVNDVAASVQVASDHYTKLLDNSDAYIQKHDAQSQALLEKFVKSTDEGIDKVRVGLESSANDVKTAISASADVFGKTVQGLLTDTTNQVTKTVAIASDHYTKLLDNSDAYIKKHDAQSQALLEKFVKSTDEGIDKVRVGLESSASAVKTAIITGAEEFDHSVQRLQGNLTSTSDQIASQSEKIREQLQDTFTEVNAHVRAMVATLSDESKSLSQTLKKTGEQVQRESQSIQVQVAESIKQMQARLENALVEVFKIQAQTMDRAADGLEEHMKKSIAKTGEGVNIQLSAIDQAMQKEVDRVMTEMGRALAQIAGQFTQDYRSLTSSMQQIVDTQIRQKK